MRPSPRCLPADLIVAPLSREQGFQLALARSMANDAIRAVALQRDRIKDRDDGAYFAVAGFRRGVDVAFLLLALRWLREACQLVAELTGDKHSPKLLATLIGGSRRRVICATFGSTSATTSKRGFRCRPVRRACPRRSPQARSSL